MYHPIIQQIDSAGIALHEFRPDLSRSLFLTAGDVQQSLYRISPFKTGRRFFDAQWCWALGHIGILYQMVRWFKKHEPQTKLILETKNQIANPFFLKAIEPYLTIVENLPDPMKEEAAFNAVYFACPDGKHHIHDYMKLVEADCKDHYLSLSDEQKEKVKGYLEILGVERPYLAVQARNLNHDPKRNVSLEEVEKSIDVKGYSVISTGLDEHPISKKIPSVKSLPNPMLASFLLSADCDRFVGSDSGAWVIPWAFQKPVQLINDHSMAWIYQ